MLNFIPPIHLNFFWNGSSLPYVTPTWLTPLHAWSTQHLLLVPNSVFLLCPSQLDVILLPSVEYQEGPISKVCDFYLTRLLCLSGTNCSQRQDKSFFRGF